MDITEQQFKAYEAVRRSGVTNMFDVRMVANLSGLDRATIIEIMKRYVELKDKYMTDRKIVEYRVWQHKAEGGDDDYWVTDTLDHAMRLCHDMRKEHPNDKIEEPLVVYEEAGKFYEATPDDLNKRTSDMIYNTEPPEDWRK